MTEFYKVSGSGNDFVAMAEPETVPSPETIRAWCRRGVSLGADGVFLLRRSPQGVAMDYYNSDGYPADLCLNGTRCAAQLAFHLGWAEDAVIVETGSGPVAARRLDTARVTLELPAPETPSAMTVEVDGIHPAGYRLRVGVPHFVLPWPESLEQAPVESLGREIRYHPAFGEAGANVNFARYPDRRRMEIRTYERGVEAETLSCGSGILASVAVGVHLGRIELPVRVSVQGGFELEVASETAADAPRWLLTGDARVVARGTLLEGAEASPPAPAWT
jgi:diaminopimelate epimerase